MSVAIRVADLTKRFQRTARYRDLLPWQEQKLTVALEKLNLNIAEGELFGLLGPNGAGKTTLIKILCSLVLPTTGTAWVFGHDVQKEEQAIRELVGLASADERSFYWRLTGWQNLEFYASLYRIPRRQAEQRIDEVLHKVGLASEADVRFQNYSTGMRQKLAIARGLLSQPRVLFVDEPTRSLDPLSAQAVRSLLREEVVRAGRTVVFATHNMEEAEAICDRVAILHHGRLIASGSVPELRSVFQRHERCELEVRYPPEGLINRLFLTDGVIDCHRAPQINGVLHLELTFLNRAAVLPQVLRLIVQGGGEVCDCRLTEVPLEEIFVHAVKRGEEGDT